MFAPGKSEFMVYFLKILTGLMLILTQIMLKKFYDFGHIGVDVNKLYPENRNSCQLS